MEDYTHLFEKTSDQHGLFFESLILLNDCKNILEIGTAYATTTKYLCRGANLTGGTVYAYDLWENHGLTNQFQQLSSKDQCDSYLRSHGIENFVLTKIDSKSKEFRELVDKNHPTIDFAFIDGCHSYDGIKNDFEVVYSKLSQTGIIVFNDTLRIDGCREFMIDLRTKYFDGTYDIVDLPFGAHERRCGVSLLVKRSYPVINLLCDEICNLEDRTEQIYSKEKDWYQSEIENSRK